MSDEKEFYIGSKEWKKQLTTRSKGFLVNFIENLITQNEKLKNKLPSKEQIEKILSKINFLEDKEETHQFWFDKWTKNEIIRLQELNLIEKE